MKRIIVLSIGLLFSSVHAQSSCEAEVAQVAEILMYESALVEKCIQLSAQGLTAEQVVEQLMQTSEARAYVGQGEDDQHKVTWAERSRIEKAVVVVIVLALIAANIYGTIYPPEYYYEDLY